MIDKSKNSFEYLLLLQNYWEKPFTIIFILVSIALWPFYDFIFSFENKIISDDLFCNKLISLILIEIIVYLFWDHSNKLPSVDNNKIGIIIAIETENDIVSTRIKKDFLSHLNNEINKQFNHFQIISLSDHHSSLFLQKKTHYLNATKGHFFINGYCSIRKQDGKDHYYLKLNAIVKHKPIPNFISALLKNEIISVFPLESTISVNDEIKEFKVTAQNISLSTRHIIADALFLSNNFALAFNLHNDLFYDKSSSDYIIKIQKILPNYLKIEAFYLAKAALKSNNIIQMNYFVDEIKKHDPNNYGARLLKAIYYFKIRDINSAMTEIEGANNKFDQAWLYSKAFLLAYKGDLDESYKIYKKAFYGNNELIVPLEVEEFILSTLDTETEKIELWYCLGLINYFKKEDFALAKEYFEKFILEAKKVNKYHKFIDHSLKYIEKINSHSTHFRLNDARAYSTHSRSGQPLTAN